MSADARDVVADAQHHFMRQNRLVAMAGATSTAVIAAVACWVTLGLPGPTVVRVATGAVIAVLLSVPFSLLVRVRMQRVAAEVYSLSDERSRRVDEAARRQDFSAKVADALEMAATEREALEVVERAFVAVLPSQPVELLLADNSHAHLSRVAHSAPDGQAPGCAVASPQDCPATRRARVQHFDDSEAINACPQLRDRPAGRCSAVCVPVSVMGRAVGVVHTTGEVGRAVVPEAAGDLEAVAAQAGSRLGLLRVMAEAQAQATTDGLTGLLNRRALENTYRVLDPAGTTTVVMADLDHFKLLNDTYGHATGDRALRVFAQTLTASLRSDDLVCRRGGEEFAMVLPGCSVSVALVALEQVRTQLEVALAQGGLPSCTASFGVVVAAHAEELEATLARADLALFAAKAAGRDRVVVHDPQEAGHPSGPTAVLRPTHALDAS